MISEAPSQAFAWVWLPGATEPVVAGRLDLDRADGSLVFRYGQSYLERENRISLFTPELPLRRGEILPLTGLTMPGCLRDGAPDAWGRRVILNRIFGAGAGAGAGGRPGTDEISELSYLLESGSDRIGALDFQISPTRYRPRSAANASLEELLSSAELVEKGIPLTSDLAAALQHGTPIGGARPKALVDDSDRKFIAKFSTSQDSYGVVKAEYMGMRLAKEVGIEVAEVHLRRALGKDVLMIRRFDRVRSGRTWERRAVVSALTILKLDEMMARYASYQNLAEAIRHDFNEPRATLKELFRRLVFNVLIGNTDDHARNHAAFWDGERLALTPAYDLCPQPRTGNQASQAMLIHGEDNRSRLATVADAASHFMMSKEEAFGEIRRQVERIRECWAEVGREAGLTEVDERMLRTRQFLNPSIFEGGETEFRSVMDLARAWRE